METSPATAVWALTARGCVLARSVASRLGGVLHVPRKYAAHFDERPFDRFTKAFATAFPLFRSHVCIAATGVVIRGLAPLLRHKSTDPAVVVLDQDGRFAVSLVGGHLGGANALALRVADILGGQAVITTATDLAGLPALDVLARDLGLVSRPHDALKAVAAAMLDGEPIQLWDPEHRLLPVLRRLGHVEIVDPVARPADWRTDRPGLWVSWKNDAPGLETPRLMPRCLVAGLGCHHGVTAEEIIGFVSTVLSRNGLALESLATLGTVQSRAVEPGLRAAAAQLDVELIFFSPEELKHVPTPHPSTVAKRLIGTHSVCEAAAMLLGRTDALLVSKIKAPKLTLAVALKTEPETTRVS